MKKKLTTKSCWKCKQKTFKPQGNKDVGRPFCKFRQEWFRPEYNFNNTIECEGYE